MFRSNCCRWYKYTRGIFGYRRSARPSDPAKLLLVTTDARCRKCAVTRRRTNFQVRSCRWQLGSGVVKHPQSFRGSAWWTRRQKSKTCYCVIGAKKEACCCVRKYFTKPKTPGLLELSSVNTSFCCFHRSRPEKKKENTKTYWRARLWRNLSLLNATLGCTGTHFEPGVLCSIEH